MVHGVMRRCFVILVTWAMSCGWNFLNCCLCSQGKFGICVGLSSTDSTHWETFSLDGLSWTLFQGVRKGKEIVDAWLWRWVCHALTSSTLSQVYHISQCNSATSGRIEQSEWTFARQIKYYLTKQQSCTKCSSTSIGDFRDFSNTLLPIFQSLHFHLWEFYSLPSRKQQT